MLSDSDAFLYFSLNYHKAIFCYIYGLYFFFDFFLSLNIIFYDVLEFMEILVNMIRNFCFINFLVAYFCTCFSIH